MNESTIMNFLLFQKQNNDFALPRSVSEGIIKFEPDDRNRPVSNAKSYYQQRPPGKRAKYFDKSSNANAIQCFCFILLLL